MLRCLTIGRREYLAAVKTKGFLIGLLVAPIMMCGGIIAMIVLRGQVDVTDKRLAVLDRSGSLGPALVAAAEARTQNDIADTNSGKRLKPAYVIELVGPRPDSLPAQRLTLSERVRQGELHAFVEIGPEALNPNTNRELSRISYHAKGAALDEIRRWVEQPLNKELQRLRLAAIGIEDTRVRDIFNWKSVEPMGLVSADRSTGEVSTPRRSSEVEAIAAPIASVILMWIMIMMGASPLLGAVMAEKSQRIMEVLLGCATPLEIMTGKLLGALGVALTSGVVYLGGAVLALFQLGLAGLAPLHLLPWFLLYVVLAILMTGGNATALGSLCNDQRDAQNLTLPSILPMLIPMFLLGPILREPHSTFAVVTSLIPPFTPILMLMRQATPTGVPLWQPLVGLVGVVAFTLVVLLASARIFRIGLLMQGKPPRFRELLRWAWRG